MKETLAAIAAMLSVFVAIGQISPSMTIGEFISLYAPVAEVTTPEESAPVAEMPSEPIIVEEPTAPTVELAPINNEVPKQEPVIIIEDPVVPTVELTVGEPATPLAKAYTEADIKAMASVIGIEARGLDPGQKKAVGRCMLNRVDDWGGTIQSVARSGAFVRTNSYTEEDLALANEELYNWSINGPRSLPEGYYYFNGDGEQNYFRKTLSGERLSLL